jgi:hypothetical protein
MSAEQIPVFVKHVALAIFRGHWSDGYLPRDELGRFVGAYAVARGFLVRHGYLAEGSDRGPDYNIKLTGKGRSRDSVHQNEGGDGIKKTTEFDRLYNKYIGGITEEQFGVGYTDVQVLGDGVVSTVEVREQKNHERAKKKLRQMATRRGKSRTKVVKPKKVTKAKKAVKR